VLVDGGGGTYIRIKSQSERSPVEHADAEVALLDPSVAGERGSVDGLEEVVGDAIKVFHGERAPAPLVLAAVAAVEALQVVPALRAADLAVLRVLGEGVRDAAWLAAAERPRGQMELIDARLLERAEVSGTGAGTRRQVYSQIG